MRLFLFLFATALAGSTFALSNEPAVGDQAPDFELTGSDGVVYKLSDFRGKKPVIIAWFPKAFTGG